MRALLNRSMGGIAVAALMVANIAVAPRAGAGGEARGLAERSLLVIRGAADDRAGTALASAGDFNGDGNDDLVAGTKADRAYVVFGGIETDLDLAEPEGRAMQIDGDPGSKFGVSVAGAGDLDADGFDDVIIGAPKALGVAGEATGAAYVVFGSEDPQPSIHAASDEEVAVILGDAPGSHFGRGVSAAGDFDGDGRAEVLVGAPRSDGNGSGSGAVYVIQGRSLVPGDPVEAASLDGTFVQGPEHSFTGWSLAAARDMNADGFDDILVGAPGRKYRSAPGQAFVVFGRDDGGVIEAGVAGFGGWTVQGRRDDRAGYSVAGGDDLDGDGVPDVIVGAPDSHVSSPHSGAAYVVLGRADETIVSASDLGAQGVELRGTASATAGTSVAWVEEVPGRDGAGALVGAPNDTARHSGTGAGYLYSPRRRPARREELGRIGGDGIEYSGARSFAFLGTAVAGLGNFHPDFEHVIAIGAPGADEDGERGRVYVVEVQEPPFADPPPDASLISYGTHQRGEIGSSCWDGLCIDRIPTFPEPDRAGRREEANIRVDFGEKAEAFSIHAYRKVDEFGHPTGSRKKLRHRLVRRRGFEADGHRVWDAVFRLPRWKRVYLEAFGRWEPTNSPRDAFWFFHLRLHRSDRTDLRTPPDVVLRSGRARQRGDDGSWCWSYAFSYGIGVGQCVDAEYVVPPAVTADAGERAFFRVKTKYRPDRYRILSYRRADDAGLPDSPTREVDYQWRKVRRGDRVVAHDAVFRLPKRRGHVFFMTRGRWKYHGNVTWRFHLRLG